MIGYKATADSGDNRTCPENKLAFPNLAEILTRYNIKFPKLNTII